MLFENFHQDEVFYIIFWRYLLYITDTWTKNFSKLENFYLTKFVQLNETDLYSFMFSTVKQTKYIQFFKQIKYLGKKRGDDDQNRIKYETCKERDSCKLCVHNTTQHNMRWRILKTINRLKIITL